MLNNCTNLQSLFSDSIVSNTLAEGPFMELEPDRTRGTVLQRQNNNWSYKTSDNDYSLVSSWLSKNNMSLPATTWLTQNYNDGNAYGDIYLTGGELALFVVYLYTYGCYEYTLGQTVDNIGENNAPITVSCDDMPVTSIPKVSSRLQRLYQLNANGVNPFCVQQTSHKVSPNGYKLIGSHTNSDGVNSESDVASLRTRTEFKGDYQTIFWCEGGLTKWSGSMARRGGPWFGILWNDGSITTFCNGVNGSEDVPMQCAVMGIYVDYASKKIHTSCRMANAVWSFPLSTKREWRWCDDTIAIPSGKYPVDVFAITNQNVNQTHLRTYLFSDGMLNRLDNGTKFVRNRLNIKGISAPNTQIDALVFRLQNDDYSYDNLESRGTWADLISTRSYIEFDYGNAGRASVRGEYPSSSTVYGQTGFDKWIVRPDLSTASVTKLNLNGYARRYAAADRIYSIARPQVLTPTKIDSYGTAKISITQVRKYVGNVVKQSYTQGGVNYRYDVNYVTEARGIHGSATPTYGNQEDATVESSEWADAGRSWFNVIDSALLLCDGFNADDIFGSAASGSVEQLQLLAAQRYSVMDTYMQMYADYTANIVVDSILNQLVLSLVTGDEEQIGVDDDGNPVYRVTRYPMQETYGVDDDTTLSVSGYSFSCKSLRESNDDVQIEAVVRAIYQLQKDLDYRLALFMEAHDAFQSVDALSSFAEKIKGKIRDIQSQATLIMNARGVASEALLLNCANNEVVYNKVSTVISNAIAAGYTSLSDALDYISRISPDLAYGFKEGSTSAVLYQSILDASTYADYKTNITNPPRELDSNVSYWKTYQLRLGSSILNQASPDAEFTTASDGALYLWPPLITAVVNSSEFDPNITAGQFFYVPLKSSYCIVRKMAGKQYGIDWCARFCGGTDADLYMAIESALNEYFSFAADLASVYADRTVTVTHDELPTGYTGDAKVDNIVGCFALLLSGALGGAFAGYGATDQDGNPVSFDYQLPNGKTGKLGASAAGGLIGVAASSIVSLSQSIWPDENGVANTNWSTSALVSTAKSNEFLQSIKVSGYSPIASNGSDAVNTLASVILWALRYGLFAPVGDYVTSGDQSPVGIGVFAPNYVTPKF